jgi:hypothetical protein
MGDQIDSAINFVRPDFVKVDVDKQVYIPLKG